MLGPRAVCGPEELGSGSVTHLGAQQGSLPDSHVWFSGACGPIWGAGIAEVRHDPGALDEPGFWAVVITFEGSLTAVRMDRVDYGSAAELRAVPRTATSAAAGGGRWTTTLDHDRYESAVEQVRRRIARGEVYQANICRLLQRRVPADFDLAALHSALLTGNPAPYAALINLPAAGLEVVCASPELYLERDADRIASAPIKGTAATAEALLPKDFTENVMITDLVRNDLAPVSIPGTVEVDGLCRVEQHPGLVHLVSTVRATLRPGVQWADILASSFPPGSVSGAPKVTALQAISDLERAPRGPYCGAIGYVDNIRDVARLAVGIRTFWLESAESGKVLKFGTGAGITWGSDPEAEWCETLLKAKRLIGLADSVLEEE